MKVTCGWFMLLFPALAVMVKLIPASIMATMPSMLAIYLLWMVIALWLILVPSGGAEKQAAGQPQVSSNCAPGSWTQTPPREGYWWMYDQDDLPFGCVVLMHHDPAHLWVYRPGHPPRLASSFSKACWWTGEIAKPDMPNAQRLPNHIKA